MVLRIIDQRFALDTLAGKGATGSVYGARDLRTGERVAVKVLLGGRTTFPRFDREVQVLGILHHPRIVGYVAHGETPEGEAFLAMEWLEGETLQKRLERSSLTPVEAIDAARAIAEALVAAHAAGVIHRDLKPANVVLVGNSIDRLKVVDFGIARPSSGSSLTATDEIIGTPAYMSPEQARASKNIDPRSDLFSLGSIVYRCISGVYPFAAEGAVNILFRLITERAAPLSSVVPSAPAGLCALVDGLLAPDPRERPPSAAHVHASLAALRAQLVDTASRVRLPVPPLAAQPPRPTPAFASPAPARRLAALYAGVFGLGVVALGGVAGVWAFTLGPFTPSAAKRRASKAVASTPDCPEGALACTDVEIADSAAVDPFSLAPAVAELSARVGGGDLAVIRAEGLGANGVDVGSGATIEYRLTNGVYVTLDRGTLVAVKAPRVLDHPPPQIGECGLKQAYLVAVAQGLSPSTPWSMRIADEGNGTGYTFAAPHSGTLTIMASNCKIGMTTIRGTDGN